MNADSYRRLMRARDFIEDCYSRPVDLNQIAREACLSRFHFLRLFRKTFDKTPHQYLTERRIERAKDLLAASDLSVTEICFEVGFESLGSFSTLFHRTVGHPPTHYRTHTSVRVPVSLLFPEPAIPACFLIRYAPRNTVRR